MNSSNAVQSHCRSILFLLLLFAAIGVLRGLSLPTGLFSQVSFPRIAVSLDAAIGRRSGWRSK